jgi:hypothetical protein
MQVSGQLHAPAALSTGKYPPEIIWLVAGMPQSRSGRSGGVKNTRPPGNRNQVV